MFAERSFQAKPTCAGTLAGTTLSTHIARDLRKRRMLWQWNLLSSHKGNPRLLLNLDRRRPLPPELFATSVAENTPMKRACAAITSVITHRGPVLSLHNVEHVVHSTVPT